MPLSRSSTSCGTSGCSGGPAGQMNRSFLLHHIAATFVGMVQWWAWNDFSVAPSDLAADYLRAVLPLFAE